MPLSRNNPINKTIAMLIALMLMVSGLSACDNGESLELRMDAVGGIASLDPQFATEPIALTVLVNTMEGLLRMDSNGTLQPAGAESYTVSGTHYTFKLRSDASWSNGDPVTADDYVFAFRRIFHHQVPSPYAENYMEIKNAKPVLDGQMGETMLGVSALDSYTLEIVLEQPNAAFVERLSEVSAMPCNEEFFTDTRARYGLGAGYLIFNGPFVVKSWNNDRSIVLRPNNDYREPPLCPGVTIYTNRIIPPQKADEKNKAMSAIELFSQGKSDVYRATAQEMELLDGDGISSMEMQNRVWQLGLNTKSGLLENPKLRRALVMSLEKGEYEARIPKMYRVAKGLIPKSAQPEGYILPDLPVFNVQWARDSAVEAYEEADEELGSDTLTLLLPQEAELVELGSYLQRQWKDTLSIYINMEPLPEEELNKRLSAGDYSLALWQLEATTADPVGILANFVTGNIGNYYGYDNEQYNELANTAARLSGSKEAVRLWEAAEQLIIDDAVALPLLNQSTYFAFGKGVNGIEFAGGLLHFNKATRTD